MATAKIAYESALPQFLTQLIGTNRNTSTTGGVTTTSDVSTSNTDPLSQIFAQQMASSTIPGMEAQLAELFRTGAMKVPELTQAYANASGTRTTGNSGLALALAELNKSLTGQAAGLVGQQQERAAQTAGAIANASRGTTRTAYAPPTNIRERTGNPQQAGLLGAAGLAANLADKSGLFKWGKDKVSGMMAPGSAAPDAFNVPMGYNYAGLPDSFGLAAPDSFGYATPGASGGLSSGGFTSDLGNYNAFSVDGFSGAGSFGTDSFGGFNPFSAMDFGFNDVSNFAGDLANGAITDLGATGWGYDAYDWGSGLDSAASAVSSYVPPADWLSDTLGSFGSGISDFLSGWFADGGHVNVAKIKASPEYRKYADGGKVESDESAKEKAALVPVSKPTPQPVPNSGGLLSAAIRAMLGRDAKLRKEADKYADGGEVIRNKNNMGEPESRMGTGAYNLTMPEPRRNQVAGPYSGAPSNMSFSSSGSNASMDSGKLFELQDYLKGENGGGVSGNGNNSNAGNYGGSTAPGTFGGMMGNLGTSVMGMAPGAVIGGPLGMALGAVMGSIMGQIGAPPSLQSQALNAVQGALGFGGPGNGPGTNAPGSTSPAGGFGSGMSAASDFGGSGGYGGGPGTDASAADATNGSDSMSDSFGGVGAGGFGGSGSFGGLGSTAGGAAGDSAGGPGVGAAGGDGSFGGGDYANGGEVDGKGTGISDSIHAKLSDGEFVISADVVDALGVDFFENLQAKFHTPAAIQKMQKSSK